MKKLLILTLLVGLAACADQPAGPSADVQQASVNPNGFPSGPHYNLNLIGVDKVMATSLSVNGSNGHRIFVRLFGGQEVCDPSVTNPEADFFCDEGDLKGGGSVNGKWKDDDVIKVNKILLTPNDDDNFQVLDANATDEDGAEFTMPRNVYGGYDVYARALGKPGGSARMTTCADEIYDETTGEIWCSMFSAVMERTKGPPKAENVTSELLSMTILLDPDLDPLLADCLGYTDTPDVDDAVEEVTVPVFNTCFENYFWNYDNHGLKLLQVRFYAVE